MPHTERALIIGVDGATFDLIDSWIAKGHLPNLVRLMASSDFGPLAADGWDNLAAAVARLVH